MSKVKFPLLGIFFLLSIKFFGQTPPNIAEKLMGTWYLSSSSASGQQNLTYTRTSATKENWGHRIEFKAPDTFVDAYSGKCGNDSGIHHDTGVWQLTDKFIITSIPVNLDKGNNFAIIELDEDHLVLQRNN